MGKGGGRGLLVHANIGQMRKNEDQIPGLNYNKLRWKKMVVERYMYVILL